MTSMKQKDVVGLQVKVVSLLYYEKHMAHPLALESRHHQATNE